LDEPELSPREIAVAFTDREHSFVSEPTRRKTIQQRAASTAKAAAPA
jgi:hypothetical protein